MSLSSPGIGSGLDIRSIVSKLVELEKRPLAQLQTSSSNLQARLSAFGQLRSQLDNLSTVMRRLSDSSTWTALTFNSSASAITGRVVNATDATPSQFAIEVSQLASAQSFGTSVLTNTSFEGSLVFSIGNFSQPDSFVDSQPITISNSDSIQDVARKVNNANVGVSATVLRDTTGERLLLRSTSTGEDFGFKISATAAGGSQLGALQLDTLSASPGQTVVPPQNALASVNGVAVSSNGNEFNNVVAGISFTASALTSPGTPAIVTVVRNTAQMRTAINDFIQSYNALNDAIAEMTRFNPTDRSAGTLQGDSTALGIQSALRRLAGSSGSGGSEFSWLSEVGVEFTKEGRLQLRPPKPGERPAIDVALERPAELQKFFGNADSTTGLGLATRIQDFVTGMLAASGPISTRNAALRSSIERNSREQERLSDKILRTEERLLAQYSRLDTQLSQLTALGNYVSQQVTLWNAQKK